MKIEALRHVSPRILSASAIAILLGLPLTVSAAPITIRSVAGADAAAIQTVVDLFRTDLGGVNNGNTLGSLATGRRELFKKIGPSDPAGVALVDAAFTPDGKSYAYSCFNALTQLYLVEGLR